MIRNSLIVLCFGCFSGVFGQQLLPIQYDTSLYSQEFFMQGLADYGATSLHNDLTKKFLYGGAITNDIKDRSNKSHNGINRVGADVSGEMEYRNYSVNLFKKQNLGFLVKGGYYNYLSLIYAKDLFGLAFYGNESYLGENIDFSGTRFSAISFQKVGFGIIDKKTKSNVALNFYSISNFSEGQIRSGQLFQSEDGDSVNLGLDGTIEMAAGSNFFKGYGIGVDLDFKIPVIFRADKVSFIQFTAKNLGVSYLNSPITRYSADTNIAYTGFEFQQLYGESSILDGNISVLDSLGIDSTSVKKVRFLPGYFQVGKIVDEMNPARIQSFFGLRVYPSIAYTPLLFAGAQIKALPWLDFGAHASYGGFTNFRVGLYSQIKFSSWSFGLATEDLVGMVSPNGRGQSIITRLRVKL
jgi:hypothetical protein